MGACGTRLVGVERFELPALCSQSRCATRLRYTPNLRIMTSCRPQINRFAAILAIVLRGSLFSAENKGNPLIFLSINGFLIQA